MLKEMGLSEAWKCFFSGEWQNHKTEIFIDQENRLLVGIKNGETGKVLLELYSAFFCDGTINNLLETSEQRLLLINSNKNKFLLVGSKREIIEEEQEALINTLSNLEKENRRMNSLVKELAKRSSCEIREITDAKIDELNAFFTEPIVLPSIIAKSAEAEFTGRYSEREQLKLARLGKTENGFVEEPLNALKQSLVVGGEKNARLHLLHLISEIALENNLPLVVLAKENEFEGMHEKNFALKENGKSFQIKEIDAKELKIDLKSSDVDAVLESFGIKNEKIKEILKTESIEKLEELIKNNEIKMPNFEKEQASRFVRLIENQKIIGDYNLKALVEDGKATVIRINGEQIECALIYSLLEKIRREKREGKAFVLMNNAELFVPDKNENAIQEALAKLVGRMASEGFGIVLEAGHERDLDKSFWNFESVFSFIQRRELVLKLKHRKPIRFELIEGKSSCKGHETELELSKEALQGIKAAKEDIKAERIFSHKQIKKELGFG